MWLSQCLAPDHAFSKECTTAYRFLPPVDADQVQPGVSLTLSGPAPTASWGLSGLVDEFDMECTASYLLPPVANSVFELGNWMYVFPHSLLCLHMFRTTTTRVVVQGCDARCLSRSPKL